MTLTNQSVQSKNLRNRSLAGKGRNSSRSETVVDADPHHLPPVAVLAIQYVPLNSEQYMATQSSIDQAIEQHINGHWGINTVRLR